MGLRRLSNPVFLQIQVFLQVWRFLMNSDDSRGETERTIITADLSVSRRLVLLIFAWTLLATPIALPSWAQRASTPASKPRVEKDLLGEKEIPANAYYGVQ